MKYSLWLIDLKRKKLKLVRLVFANILFSAWYHMAFIIIKQKDHIIFAKKCENKPEAHRAQTTISQSHRFGDTSDESTGIMSSVNRLSDWSISVSFAQRQNLACPCKPKNDGESPVQGCAGGGLSGSPALRIALTILSMTDRSLIDDVLAYHSNENLGLIRRTSWASAWASLSRPIIL